jgi:hypothetical protein
MGVNKFGFFNTLENTQSLEFMLFLQNIRLIFKKYLYVRRNCSHQKN